MTPKPLSQLRIEAVSHAALHDISMSAEGPGLVVLTGRSGAGKSTLCHLIAGLERPRIGTVRFDGLDPADITDWSLIGVLPQRGTLLEHLTGAGNLALPAGLSGRPRPEPEQLHELFVALSVETLWNRPVGEGSVGEQQRVGVARALSLRPRLGVLDEPTGHQDERNAELVRAAIIAAAQSSLVVVATHDPGLIELARLEFSVSALAAVAVRGP